MPAQPKPTLAGTLRRTKKAKAPSAERFPQASVPGERQIRAATAGLTTIDQSEFARTMTLLADHLGSPAAAQLWLVTPSADFGSTPLTAIQDGESEAVLAFLEGQWSLARSMRNVDWSLLNLAVQISKNVVVTPLPP
jgi:hypothetical protein